MWEQESWSQPLSLSMETREAKKQTFQYSIHGSFLSLLLFFMFYLFICRGPVWSIGYNAGSEILWGLSPTPQVSLGGCFVLKEKRKYRTSK